MIFKTAIFSLINNVLLFLWVTVPHIYSSQADTMWDHASFSCINVK